MLVAEFDELFRLNFLQMFGLLRSLASFQVPTHRRKIILIATTILRKG